MRAACGRQGDGRDGMRVSEGCDWLELGDEEDEIWREEMRSRIRKEERNCLVVLWYF